MKFSHDKYLKYEELTLALKQIAQEFPGLAKLESLGSSLQGRDYWFVTITDFSKGSHDSKPAMFVDGNTHAGEVVGSQACLYLIDYLTSEHRDSTAIQNLLQNFTFYVFPRISVDGAEAYLTTPDFYRSSPLMWPHEEKVQGFYPEDMDGDGRVLQMRVPDPAGPYKISKKNPRLLVPRDPTDFDQSEGPFYRLMQEGQFYHYDGFTQEERTPYGFDLNRQSPADFHPKESGAGPYPMFLKEAQVLAKAFVDRPNIVGVHTHHSYGGLLLRPSSLRADSDLPSFDLEVYKMLEKMGEQITGYKAHSVYHDFRYDPKEVTTGAWDDWHYDHRGLFSFTPEIWSLVSQVGYKLSSPLEVYKGLPEDVMIQILDWCSKNIPNGNYFSDWKKFQHPQLGEVEIGGWHYKFVIQNPPENLLKDELGKLAQFTIAQAKVSPLVKVKEVVVKPLSPSTFSVHLVLQNQGYLPTHVSEQMNKLRLPKKPFMQLKLQPSQNLLSGSTWSEIPHLTGRSRNVPWVSAMSFGDAGNSNECQLKWIVEGQGSLSFSADFLSGGKIGLSIDLR